MSRERSAVRARSVFILLSCILPWPSGNGESGQNTCVVGASLSEPEIGKGGSELGVVDPHILSLPKSNVYIGRYDYCVKK